MNFLAMILVFSVVAADDCGVFEQYIGSFNYNTQDFITEIVSSSEMPSLLVKLDSKYEALKER